MKSPPELWAECSDAESLVRHLGEFGEIKITRLEPETTVAWEGERASGTVEIKPSGWGTRVTLRVQTTAAEPVPSDAGLVALPLTENHPVEEARPPDEPDPVEEAADAKVEETSTVPDLAVAADPAPARGWKRLIALTRTWLRPRSPTIEVKEEPVVEAPKAPVEREPPPDEPEATPSPEAGTPSIDPRAALSAALDSLGQAHHRPYSRA